MKFTALNLLLVLAGSLTIPLLTTSCVGPAERSEIRQETRVENRVENRQDRRRGWD